MYYNKKKISKKEKCYRVLNLYCNSLSYHAEVLGNGDMTFEDFKYDVFGLLESLKRYVTANKKLVSEPAIRKLNAINLNEYKNSDLALLAIDGLSRTLKN